MQANMKKEEYLISLLISVPGVQYTRRVTLILNIVGGNCFKATSPVMTMHVVRFN